MPTVTDRRTALQLKKLIKKCDCFLLLATANSLDSIWVPWELGIADGIKRNKDILIAPIDDPDDFIVGREYLDIYDSLYYETGDDASIYSPRGFLRSGIVDWLVSKQGNHE